MPLKMDENIPIKAEITLSAGKGGVLAHGEKVKIQLLAYNEKAVLRTSNMRLTREMAIREKQEGANCCFNERYQGIIYTEKGKTKQQIMDEFLLKIKKLQDKK